MLKEVRTYPATRGSSAEPAIFYVVCEFVPTSRFADDRFQGISRLTNSLPPAKNANRK